MSVDISAKLEDSLNCQEEQAKLVALIGSFGKLEESRKDYIRELTRKLADIHCDGKCVYMVPYGTV